MYATVTVTVTVMSPSYMHPSYHLEHSESIVSLHAMDVSCMYVTVTMSPSYNMVVTVVAVTVY